jgi:predicted transcriptional regulator
MKGHHRRGARRHPRAHGPGIRDSAVFKYLRNALGLERWETGHREEERHRLTLEAFADVDAGHVIDHQAVQAWADGLGTRKSRPPPRR